MPSLKELRERRGELEKKFQDIVNRAESEDRNLSAEEEATLAQIDNDDKSLKQRIERQEKLDKLGKELDEPADPDASRRFSGRGSAAGDESRGVPEDAAEAQALAIQGWCRHQMGEEVTQEQQAACESLKINPRSQKLEIELSKSWDRFRNQWRNGLTTPNPAKGGTLIAPSFSNRLEMAMLWHGPMLQVAELMDTDTGAQMPYPTINDTSNEGSMVAELDEAAEQDIATSSIVFGAHEATSKVVIVSQSMLDDSAFDLSNVLADALGERLGRLLNRKCTLGSLANEPRGIVPRSALGNTTASGTAITVDEVLGLIGAVDIAYRQQPGFGLMAHDNIWTAIKKLKATDGNFLWQRSIQEGTPDKFDGYPIWTNNHMQSSIATATKTMLAGLFPKYKIRRVRSVQLRRMTEKYATQNADGFVAFMRFDGDLVDAGTNPVKHLLQA